MRHLRLVLFLSFLVFSFFVSSAAAQMLRVTSTPSGAKVEIDGVAVGTTPYEAKVPAGYFHKTHSVFSARLEHEMALRVSLDGYTTKEIVMTEGPMRWVALNGTDHGNYWLLKTAHFDVALEPLSKSFTGTVTATAPGNSKVEMRAELSVEDLVEKCKPAVVLLMASSRMGSGFFIGFIEPVSAGFQSKECAKQFFIRTDAEIMSVRKLVENPSDPTHSLSLNAVEIAANFINFWLHASVDSSKGIEATMQIT